MHISYQSYLDFENRHNLIIKLIERYFLPNNQYSKPHIFTHIVFKYKKH
jgi:hypothetical protein